LQAEAFFDPRSFLCPPKCNEGGSEEDSEGLLAVRGER